MTAPPDGPALEVTGLAKRFGGITALRQVDLTIDHGQVLGVIGPNGSGKTTMINVLSGAYRPDKGTVTLNGRNVARLPAHRRVGLGMARTFQNPHVFRSLTVRRNLLLSVGRHRGVGVDVADVDKWLQLVDLAGVADRVASELSGGQQKLVEFARAMVTKPTVVLMDEPFAGVHPAIKATMHRCIRQVSVQDGVAVLVVSHEVPDLVALSNQFLCMAAGSVLVAGTPEAVCADPRVIDAYLGSPVEQAS